MPTAKRQKKGRHPSPRIRRHQKLQRKKGSVVKVKNDILKKDIWSILERDNFPDKSLLVLEGLQTLESYLWPGYSDDSSNHHVILIVLLVNVKRREQLESWTIFEDRPDEFSGLFRRVLTMTLDHTLSPTIRSHLLSFLISAFQSLDCAIVRKECAPLVSISIWHNLSTDTLRETKLEQYPHVRKAWRAAAKRHDAADEVTKARLRFERSWLYTLVLDFLKRLYDEDTKPEHILYCERFVEFLTDLLIFDKDSFLVEILLSNYEGRKTFQQIAQNLSLVPTENSLFESNLIRAEKYDGTHPLAMPKLNLQYLSVGDFLWRSLTLYRSEAFYGIRKDVETAVRRLRPEAPKPGEVKFLGSSKMALPASKVSILEVVPALVGDDKPSTVRAELTVDYRRVAEGTRRDWDSLRPDDVVFLLAIEPTASDGTANGEGTTSEAQRLGVTAIRTAEVIAITDDKGRTARELNGRHDGKRTFRLKLDAGTYARDAELTGENEPAVYGRINVILRRSGRENNFKPVLESIRSLTLSDVPVASWLHEVFLGYGDPAGATYKQLPNRVKRLDYRDTFLDWQHLIESLPGKIIEPNDDASGSFGPPYVLEAADTPAVLLPKPTKKRRRDAEPPLSVEVETVKVSTYKPPNEGPFPVDAPKLNAVRFTSAQIEAITSGSQPGLTVIVGPPGTGKTDVASQIINNIYHNFPEQRTLLIAHSNQALNQLFAKIIALDIDERHLLRLGHGEEDLYTEGSFSKHGRVESFLDNRDRYLQEVNLLASSIGAPGAHGNSAETAGYFNSVYIEPAWAKFMEAAKSETAMTATVIEAFPFHKFFSTAPQPLFPDDADHQKALEIAEGCYRHISKIFSELADVLPFEILRRDKDTSNYLLINESLFSRLVRLGVPTINLDQQGRARPAIANFDEFLKANAGFKFDYQFINVPDYKGKGEAEPTPHFIQNLGEAEYAVAIYQYMRLLGYPASKISILTTYAGQRALVNDVLAHRCSNKAIFGRPRVVSTVDKYQGEQNDYIILSLTRTSRVGYLRDVRRMTVALSRARLGLYILGRRDVFEACYELRPAFEQLLQRPDKLMLVTGEMWPSQRLIASESGEVPGEACMEGVEHLGQFVYQMTNTKVKQLEAEQNPGGAGLLAIEEAPAEEAGEGDPESAVAETEG
ncbi:RNA helicase aquarius like protein [Verticillium longisporum]|uniref:RNA helicase aquarius like protein n=1 Tax=Verticillium longisporum TaxID=100787 RepID=A0A8I2ZW91_VERLO|nr:RNA helicase aquarius like protein [Verticillium longisporum]